MSDLYTPSTGARLAIVHASPMNEYILATCSHKQAATTWQAKSNGQALKNFSHPPGERKTKIVVCVSKL